MYRSDKDAIFARAAAAYDELDEAEGFADVVPAAPTMDQDAAALLAQAEEYEAELRAVLQARARSRARANGNANAKTTEQSKAPQRERYREALSDWYTLGRDVRTRGAALSEGAKSDLIGARPKSAGVASDDAYAAMAAALEKQNRKMRDALATLSTPTPTPTPTPADAPAPVTVIAPVTTGEALPFSRGNATLGWAGAVFSLVAIVVVVATHRFNSLWMLALLVAASRLIASATTKAWISLDEDGVRIKAGSKSEFVPFKDILAVHIARFNLLVDNPRPSAHLVIVLRTGRNIQYRYDGTRESEAKLEAWVAEASARHQAATKK